MYRIRFHGRGGQGMKTASRILGTALFLEGFEVQDAPRYGAERRGAPIFAYVRAGRETINERGIIGRPDLVVVADETLLAVPAAGVLDGDCRKAVFLIYSDKEPQFWRQRLPLSGPVVTLWLGGEEEPLKPKYLGAVSAAGAARLLGLLSSDTLEEAIRLELAELGARVVERNLEKALAAYRLMDAHAGMVTTRQVAAAHDFRSPGWTCLPFEPAAISAPAIFAPATSERVETGLWRTVRPVIDSSRCSRCGLCATLCPEGAIRIGADGCPRIDYRHCKGCLICAEQCPARAIDAITEIEADKHKPKGGEA